MKKFVNSLSIFRIVAAFAIVPTLMFHLYWLTFILFALAGFSDFFDGLLAKKYNVCSKLGGVLDHIGDKLLVVNTMIMLTVMVPVWFALVPIIVMIAREIYVSGLREFMGTHKIEMPVPSPRFSVAKIKNTFQMVTIGSFLLVFALGSVIQSGIPLSRLVIFILSILPIIAIWGLWLSLIASLWSAASYTLDFAKKMKKIK
jgi:cardiolipin synthase